MRRESSSGSSNTSTGDVTGEKITLLSSANQFRPIDALLGRLRDSSVCRPVLGDMLGNIPEQELETGQIHDDCSHATDGNLSDEDYDGELWYRSVFGSHGSVGGNVYGYAGGVGYTPNYGLVHDDETPVQRLLRRYNEGSSGFDLNVLSRYIGVDRVGEEANIQNLTIGTDGNETTESLTQQLTQLSEQSMMDLINEADSSISSDGESVLDSHEISVDMIESLLEILQAPITAVGASDLEISKLPVQIISTTRHMDSCCPICLVEFATGDTALEYPGCLHNYHQTCLSECKAKTQLSRTI
ncbi:hypothetical protein HK100_001503 [Physocladia obscura]|uniref:RING-type domain-containing protein n=1 Tax=Physocladia obscura TaxID=109957 RepID=A0AAD5XEU2_9FUNG|nr:hypothetical protein HK100_001503 [Physocladia obscura]